MMLKRLSRSYTKNEFKKISLSPVELGFVEMLSIHYKIQSQSDRAGIFKCSSLKANCLSHAMKV